jgi:iron(III) transport system permease protein
VSPAIGAATSLRHILHCPPPRDRLKSRQTFLRIVVPLMLGGIVSGIVLSSVTVASERSATVVLCCGGAGIAAAAASALIVVTLLPIALLFRLVRRYELG